MPINAGMMSSDRETARKVAPGAKFGRLCVISYDGNKKWKCVCDCGTVVSVRADSLTSGNTKSCGCYNRDMTRLKNTTNGAKHKYKRLHSVWAEMIQRCTNPNSNAYARYGGRGIFVCDEWRHSFASFRDWAYANGYDPNAAKFQCTIDRIDNDDGYYPENCRWVSMKVQARNKSNNKKNSSTGNETSAGCGQVLKRPVEQIDDSGNVLCRYESIAAAGRACGFKGSNDHIGEVCSGRRKHALGYAWRYAD